MAAAANPPPDEPDDAAPLARHAAHLADAIEATVAGWAERCVLERWSQWYRAEPSAAARQAAHDAGAQVHAEVMPALRELLHTDVDAQRTNPLSILRGAVSAPTAVLRELGVPAVERDEQAERMFPDDDYDLVPASFADIDPSVHEPGLVWGAAKAHVILKRRRRTSG